MRQTINRAILAPDDYVIELDYEASDGAITHRTISPVRFLATERFLALCLCREEPRQFYLERCTNVRLVNAADVLMPVAMG